MKELFTKPDVFEKNDCFFVSRYWLHKTETLTTALISLPEKKLSISQIVEIGDKNFAFLYHLIDRILFDLDLNLRDRILNTIKDVTCNFYYNNFSREVSLEEFKEEIDYLHINWAKFRRIHSEEAIGTLLYEYSKDITEIMFNERLGYIIYHIYGILLEDYEHTKYDITMNQICKVDD